MDRAVTVVYVQEILLVKNRVECFCSLVARGTMGRDFFCVPQGPIMGPCPNAKYPIFSQNRLKKFPIRK